MLQRFQFFSRILRTKFNSFPYLSSEDSSMIFIIDFKIYGDELYCKSVKPNINEAC